MASDGELQRRMLVEQVVANEAKSTGVTYLLWFFLGAFGVHRFYLGHVFRGLVMLCLLIAGVLTAPIGIGLLPLGFLALWLLLDLFFIPALVNEHRAKLRKRLLAGNYTP